MNKVDKPDSEENKDEQITPRIDSDLRKAHKDHILLKNNGEYRNRFSESIEQAMRLQMAVWILKHKYEFQRAYDEEFVEDPDNLINETVKSVKELTDVLHEVQSQVEALASLDEDEINKERIMTLPSANTEDEPQPQTAPTPFDEFRERIDETAGYLEELNSELMEHLDEEDDSGGDKQENEPTV
jgi:hypothetical protein